MTNTETKTRPSENTITRRKMLQSLPLATVALASSAVAASPGRPASEEPSQALLDLIRDHRHAWEIFGQAVTDADDMHPNYGGPEAEAIRDMRSDAELEARHLLLAFPVTSLTDARAKTSYLTGEKFGLDENDMATLLQSIAEPESTSGPQTPHRAIQAAPFAQVVDPVFAAIAALEAADERSSVAYEALDDAETDARAQHGNRPCELIAWRNYSAIGGSEIDNRRELFLGQSGANPVQIEIEYRDAKRRLAERVQEARAWDKRAGIVALREEHERARDGFWEAAEVIAETMPTSVAGAHALLDLAAKELEWSDDEWIRQALQNATTAIRALGMNRPSVA